MRCGRRARAVFAVSVLSVVGAPSAVGRAADTLVPISQQRYVMGTMFDIVAYHASRTEAERGIEQAMQEIVRLDQVMSDYKADSDLSHLNREGRRGFVAVDPSLYEIVEQSISFSRRTGGRFDVTIAPLLKLWKDAYAAGRTPADDEIAAVKRCVGSEQIELSAPNRIRFRSDCLAIDLGGVGKGYAVDRALAVLVSAGIKHALINAGGSSIGAVGAPPGQQGWPVKLGARVNGSDVLLLRDASMSTSQQNLRVMTAAPGFGEILDPRAGAPVQQRTAVTVVTPSGTVAEALTKALLMVPIDEAPALLTSFPDVSALWMSPAGELLGAHRASQLPVSASSASSSATH
jgi:FAD:protein FMN transferase